MPERDERGCNSRSGRNTNIRIAKRPRTTSAFSVRKKMNYKSKRWQRLRTQALKRDGYMCQEAIRYGRHIEATTVHHILPAETFPEYEWELWNLVSLSAAEHNAMHTRDGAELTDKGLALMNKTAAARGISI